MFYELFHMNSLFQFVWATIVLIPEVSGFYTKLVVLKIHVNISFNN